MDDELSDVTNEEADAVDQAMANHMYGHQISNSYAGMSCTVSCRTSALARAIDKYVLLPRRERRINGMEGHP